MYFDRSTNDRFGDPTKRSSHPPPPPRPLRETLLDQCWGRGNTEGGEATGPAAFEEERGEGASAFRVRASFPSSAWPAPPDRGRCGARCAAPTASPRAPW